MTDIPKEILDKIKSAFSSVGQTSAQYGYSLALPTINELKGENHNLKEDNIWKDNQLAYANKINANHASKVLEAEARIRELETENEALKKEIKELNFAINELQNGMKLNNEIINNQQALIVSAERRALQKFEEEQKLKNQ